VHSIGLESQKDTTMGALEATKIPTNSKDSAIAFSTPERERAGGGSPAVVHLPGNRQLVQHVHSLLAVDADVISPLRIQQLLSFSPLRQNGLHLLIPEI